MFFSSYKNWPVHVIFMQNTKMADTTSWSFQYWLNLVISITKYVVFSAMESANAHKKEKVLQKPGKCS